jgi:hypothetical protein
LKNTLWTQAAKRYLLPQLPGWAATGWIVYPTPADGPLSRVLVTSVMSYRTHFVVNATVQLLVVPRKHWLAECIAPLGGDLKRFPVPETVADFEPVMLDIAELARRDALPFFDTQATLAARLRYLHGRVADLDRVVGGGGWQDMNLDEELVYTNLLLGDLDQAHTYAAWADRALAVRPVDWAVTAHQRVTRVMLASQDSLDAAIRILDEHEAFTREKLKLPQR